MTILRVALGLLIAVLCAEAALLSWSAHIPDLAVLTTPWKTQFGLVFPGFEPGQTFTCERDGLARIDVALVTIADGRTPQPIELVLHKDSRDGEVLRRARPASLDLPKLGDFARFEFEPIERSAGATFCFELVRADGRDTSNVSPWTRFRGQVRSVRPWGDRPLPGPELEGEFQCTDPNLRGLAIAMDGVDAASGPATLQVWEKGATGEPLRNAQLRPSAPLAQGWALFEFPAVPDSRFRKYRFQLSLPPNARAVGTADGASLFLLYGEGVVDSRLAGMHVGAEHLADRDLIFRAWSEGGPKRLWSLLRERTGAGLVPTIALWVVATTALLVLVAKATRPDSRA